MKKPGEGSLAASSRGRKQTADKKEVWSRFCFHRSDVRACVEHNSDQIFGGGGPSY